MTNNDKLQKDLAKFGLKSEEVKIYLLLLKQGSLPATAIAAETGIFLNSIYRSAKELVDLGLIKDLDTWPKRYQAITPSAGIKSLAEMKANRIKDLGEELLAELSVKQNPNRLNMELLTGRKELFDRFVYLAKDTKQEVLVISIGEPVPQDIWDTIRKLLNKDVQAKFIFHRYEAGNMMLVKRWLVMGVQVRHLPGEGYHLNIFDSSSAILSASNPDLSKERTGVVIYNEAIIEALRSYFYQQWAIAKPLKATFDFNNLRDDDS